MLPEDAPSANSTQGTAGANLAAAALEEEEMMGWSSKLEALEKYLKERRDLLNDCIKAYECEKDEDRTVVMERRTEWETKKSAKVAATDQGVKE
jgi:hypothetical protein